MTVGRIHVCEPTNWLRVLVTKIRDQNTKRAEFRHYANLIGEYLIMMAVNQKMIPLDHNLAITTPTGSVVEDGVRLCTGDKAVVAVSIVRAGNAFVDSVLRLLSSSVQIGQLVIQRDEQTALPITLLDKLPSKIIEADCVLVLDPMLATGGSVIAGIDVLVAHGVAAEKIVLIHAFGCPEGIAAVSRAYPSIRGIVAIKDSHLNERKYIIPGIGDFGDRFYCD